MRRRLLGKTGLEVSELGFGSLFTSMLGPGFEASRQYRSITCSSP